MFHSQDYHIFRKRRAKIQEANMSHLRTRFEQRWAQQQRKAAAQNRQCPYPKCYCSLGGNVNGCIAVTVFRWTRVALQHSQYVAPCVGRMNTTL